MKYSKQCLTYMIICLFIALLLPWGVVAQEVPRPETYMWPQEKVQEIKKFFDDPTPLFNTWNQKNILPPEVYKMISGDPEEMKAAWAEVVGFKAPDEVGKIHPEIKPGKYTYKDVQANPAFKDLMWPDLYNRIKPGAPPHAGNIPEFEIIPTRQYYYHTRISEATKKNAGKTKLDDNGYVDYRTWEGGFPFPVPSGQFKAQQIAYNAFVFRRDRYEGNGRAYGKMFAFDRNLKIDFEQEFTSETVSLAARSYLPPYGSFDENAKKRGELGVLTLFFKSPRDLAGMAVMTTSYLDPLKSNAAVMYIPSMRRIRKMSTTDTQDPIAGQDIIYDDQATFQQKLSPERYPYKYEVEEREYLVAAPTIDGSEYVTSEGYEIRGLKFERRPIYVLKMTQMDPNYVYSKRIFYIDKESYMIYQSENYDQKGRLYRTFWHPNKFHPEMGMLTWGGYVLMCDHIDLHSGIQLFADQCVIFTREDLVAALRKGAK